MKPYDDGVMVWALICLVLAALFGGGIAQDDPVRAFICGPLFGLVFGWGIAKLGVRITLGAKD